MAEADHIRRPFPNRHEPQNTEQGMSNHEVFYLKPFDILRFLVGYSAVSSCVKGARKWRSFASFRVPCGARDLPGLVFQQGNT